MTQKANSVSDYVRIWEKVLEDIKKEIEPMLFDSFFSTTFIQKIDGSIVYVMCESNLSKTLLIDRYQSYVEEKINHITSSNFTVNFITKDDNISEVKVNDLPKSIEPIYFKNSIIDPTYTFENFVVGSCNNEAYKASLIAATNPGYFQTLFIYGGSGLGKTHLLNAIGNMIKSTLPEKKILYTSAQNFLNEYLDFVNGESKKEQLLSYLKRFDILLIDDIQMLKDKKKTQEFFFNIYEDFRQNKKQICVTSDKLPGDLDGIDHRIITRFTSGLSVPIYKPDTETCKAILLKKIENSGYSLSTYDEDVINFMSEKFKDSIRSLEGALIRLNFYASINSIDHINIDLCVEALQSMVDCSDAKKSVSEQKILSTVSQYYNVSVNQLTGKIKVANIVNARHIAIYLIKTLLDLPFKKIGKLFSNRDHSTIMHSVEKVEKMLKDDEATQIAIEQLKKRITS